MGHGDKKPNSPPLIGHTHGVQSVAFSPDGKTLASGAFDSTISLWDVATKTEIATIPYENSVTSVSFSPDGKTLVSSAFNGKVAFWDVGKRAFKDQFLVRSVNLLRYASFTLDGGRIVTASQDGDIKIWEVDLDAKTYRRIARLQGNSGDQLLGAGATFSPDGTTFATSLGSGYERGGDYTIVLWDLSPYVTPVVHVADFNLKAAIREALGKSGYGPLTRDDMERLTTLDVRNREIRDLTGLEWATQLTHLNLEGNPLNSSAASTHLPALEARGVEVLFPRSPQVLAKLSGDGQQAPSGTPVEDPLIVEVRDQNGVGLRGSAVTFAVIRGEGALSVETATTDAQGRAATTLTPLMAGTVTVEVTVEGLEPVIFTAVGQLIPQTLTKLSGDEQQGLAGAALPEPLVVQVLDQIGNVIEGVQVTFAITAGDGTLSVETPITDTQGRAASTLTPLVGGTLSVEVTVEGLEPVIFTAGGQASPDFDGDGQVGFDDFFLFAESFGTSEPHFDLDGDGQVGFDDFFLFAESFGQPARAKLLALARERIGLPEGPQLLPNAPNPFNSQTVLSYFLLRPGLARLEVFALTGQRVALLHEGVEKAGLHRLHWEGRSDQGHPLASGVYVYRLVTGDGVQTRKLTLLR